MSGISSFHGEIDEIPFISVDNFENRNKRAYFLSHCHKDHTSGLYYKDFILKALENEAYVYMSEMSAAIVLHECFDPELFSKVIRPLSTGSHLIQVPEDENKNKEEILFNVKLIPAGHCFGSVMFLFLLPNKTILYTGDFRISPNSLSGYGQLHDKKEHPIKLDALYVDTTFQSCNYENFPKRSDIIEVVIRKIKDWLDKENSIVALKTSAKYGYEYIFNEIYKKLNVKVYVNEYMWKLYSQYPSLIRGVTNDKSSRVILCDYRCRNTIHQGVCVGQEKDRKEILNIHFSAMKWSSINENFEAITGTPDNISVCYATHCSHTELKYFVNYFSPEKIVGFKIPYNIKSPMKKFEDSFSPSPKKSKVDVVNGSNVTKVSKNLLDILFKD